MDAREQLTEILEQLKQINRRLVDLEQRTEDIGASQQQIAKRVEETRHGSPVPFPKIA